MVDDPCMGVLFHLCIVCKASFHEFLDYSIKTLPLLLKKMEVNENEELYKRFVVFEKGKENPYWDEKYIYKLVKSNLQRFTMECCSTWCSKELQHQLHTHVKCFNETSQYFLRCKQVVLL